MSNGEPLSLDAAMALEIGVWTALKAGDAAADAAALAADFLGVYPSGFASRADHVEQLDAGPSIAEFALSDPRLDLIAPDAALLTYRACFARAQFLLTQNDGETVAADRALTAERAAKGWRVRGDVYLSAARQNGAYRIDCLASEDGVALDLIPLGAPERIDR